jgi:hypothetical protein
MLLLSNGAIGQAFHMGISDENVLCSMQAAAWYCQDINAGSDGDGDDEEKFDPINRDVGCGTAVAQRHSSSLSPFLRGTAERRAAAARALGRERFLDLAQRLVAAFVQLGVGCVAAGKRGARSCQCASHPVNTSALCWGALAVLQCVSLQCEV